MGQSPSRGLDHWTLAKYHTLYFIHSDKKYFSVLLDVEEEGLGNELDNIKVTIYYLMFTKYVKTFHKKEVYMVLSTQ